jgi:hypothetical protein
MINSGCTETKSLCAVLPSYNLLLLLRRKAVSDYDPVYFDGLIRVKSQVDRLVISISKDREHVVDTVLDQIDDQLGFLRTSDLIGRGGEYPQVGKLTCESYNQLAIFFFLIDHFYRHWENPF